MFDFLQPMPQAAAAQDSATVWISLLARLSLALILGVVVALIHRLTQRAGAPDSSSFMATLVLLCILIAMSTEVIGTNAARAFSLVGALSIIRFRTVVEDTRDTAFVIFAVIIGMAIGADNYTVAIVGLGVVGLAAFLLRLLPQNGARDAGDWTLQLRVAAGMSATPWDEVFQKHCQYIQLIGTATARQGAALELTYRLKLKPESTPMLLVAEINRLEGIQNLEVRRS